MKKLLFLFSFLSLNSFGQLVIDNTSWTPEQLVQNYLIGTGVTVSNVTYNGVMSAPVNNTIGYFTSTATPVGLASGVIMGTGNVQGALGPNTSGSFSLGGGIFGASDPDLELMTGDTYNDAAVLEFDFVPNGDSVKFKYVFASEEYPEFVNSVNDIFGFFLSGPGLSGPFTGGAVNIALVPGSATYVSINTINEGNYSCPGPATGCVSCAYYINNCVSTTLQYDGLTTTLTAMAPVQCGQTYHIKLAIADALDAAWDSGVFLEEGSFSSNAIDVTIATPTSTAFVNGQIYEECLIGTTATFYLVRPDVALADTVPFSFTGSATIGIDYTSSTPDTFAVFPAGEDTAFFGVTILPDGVPEGLDSLVVTVYNINVCGDTIISSATLYINDPLIILTDVLDDTINCAGELVNLVGNASGSPLPMSYQWTGPGLSATTQNTTYNPTGTSTIIFTATDQCGFTGSDTATITLITIPVFADAGPDDTTYCPGTMLTLTGSGSSGIAPYTYQWNAPGLSATTQSTTYSPTTSQMVILTVTDNCSSTDSDTMNIVFIPVPVIANAGIDQNPTCPGDNVTITGSGIAGTAPYNFSWSNGAVTASTTVSPSSTQPYILTIIDNCGQTDTDTMLVNVPVLAPFVLTYSAAENVNCPGDIANLPVTVVSGGLAPYTYDWSNGGITSTGVYPVFSNPTMATVTVEDQCNNDTTVAITLTYTVYDPLAVNTSGGAICFNVDGTVGLTVSVSGGAGGFTYDWDEPGAAIAVVDASGATVVTFPEDGTYTIYVTDVCGNTASDTAEVNVIPCEITIPNVVTPNNDNVNDEIHILNLEYHPKSSFTLFNRWGQVMYESSDYKNDYSPKELSDGVYFYVLILTDGYEPAENTGQIHVIKK